jgi:DNA-binding MarR family transcriptional regulator
MEAAVRPMGYWIKEIDRRIEAAFGRLLADEGLTRRHWQVLTTLAREETVRTELDAALAPFAATVRPELDDLIGRGWVAERPAGTVGLTAAGRLAHDRVAERVRSLRAHVTEGLTEQDYLTLLTLLERVAGNLTPA